MIEPQKYPRFWQALVLVVVAFALQMAVAVPFGIVDAVWHTKLITHPGIVSGVSLLSFGAVLAWGVSRAKTPVPILFPLRPVPPLLCLFMAAALLGEIILQSEADNLLRSVLPMPRILERFFSELTSGHRSLWGSILCLAIVAPLTEELLFRGLILRGFLGNYSVRKAVVASAALFTLLHFNPWQLLGPLTMGVILGWWYVETRSLLPCLLGHAFCNTMPILASALGVRVRGLFPTGTGKVEFHPWWLDVGGLVLFAAGLVALVIIFRRLRRAPERAEKEVTADNADGADKKASV